MEKEGVIPSKLIDVNCTITKAGNKRGMCTFYYCLRPVELLGLMLRQMLLDNACKSSLSFSALINMLVVTVGFDKSDSDFIGTWRACNRVRGDLAVYVQLFVCLEVPVTENYENESKTIGNDRFPVRQTVHSLMDDSLHCLVLMAWGVGQVRLCSCFVFMPVPAVCSKIRPVCVNLKQLTISKSTV